MANIGTSADDVLSGGDPILGLGGADSLTTNYHTGLLDGGSGTDTVSVVYANTTTPFSDATNWQLIGGNGDDSLSVSSNISNNGTARNFNPSVLAIGGQGDDTISIYQNIDLFDVTFTTFPSINANTTVIDTSGDNIVSVANGLTSADNSLDALTTVVMGGGDDSVMIANSGDANNSSPWSDHYVELGGGNDTLTLTDVVGVTDSIIYAGNGNDSLSTTFFANEGNDNGVAFDILQDTGAGNDTVQLSLQYGSFGNALDDSNIDGVFNLGGGNDNLDINTQIWGDFTIDTGQGTNVVQVKYTSLPGPLSDDALVDVTGGGGKDTVTIEGNIDDGFQFVNTNLDTGFGNDVINITKTADNTVKSGDNNDVIYVDAYTDDFNGIDRSSLIDGGNGNDTITVRDLSVTSVASRTHDITGGSGNDMISSQIVGAGQHLITGDGGNDQINVFGGADAVIDGGTGSDTIVGGAGDDAITGGGGADNLAGGFGDDTLAGNAGADTFAFNVTANQGDDVITDWNEVVDRLDVNLTDNNANGLVDEFDAIASYSTIGTDLLVSFSGGGSITFAGAGPVTSIADIMDDPLMQLV